jgi:DNA-directed RNA polymerase subunit RPC12/RpoP
LADNVVPSVQASTTPTESSTPDTQLPGYKYGRALAEAARSAAYPFTRTFKNNWDFLIGKDHWRIPATAAAMALDEWTCKSVRNYLFAVVDDKAASVSAGDPSVIVEPMDEKTTYYQRLLISSAIEHELKRLNARKVARNVYLWGSACGIGVSMMTTKPDPVTGSMGIKLTAIDPSEFFPDPSADSLETCRYVVWEPLLDMSVIRELFESKAAYVKPEFQSVSGQPSGITYKPSSTDDNLIYGPAHEFVVDSGSMLKIRKARTCFIWIRDEDSLIRELRQTVLRQGTEGYKCSECGVVHEDGSTDYELTADHACPMCGGDLSRVEIPSDVRNEFVMRRKYPFGRLIVYSGATLLYDGPNPHEIDQVFPFAVYPHYDVPSGSFWKVGDVSLLRSVQGVADVTMGQVVDYVRLAANGPIIVPIGEPAFIKLGNAPNQIIPMKPQNCSLPRYMTPTNFNVQAVDLLERMLQRDFQVVSGRTDPVAGMPSAFPLSSEQAVGQQQSFSSRIGAHRRRMDDYESTVASIVWQLMQQHYEDPMTVGVTMPNSELQSVQMEVQTLPRDVRVRVSTSLEKMHADKNVGQNLTMMLQSGIIPPQVAQTMLDVFLPLVVKDPEVARQVMERINIDKEINPQGPQAPQPMGGPNAQLQPEYGAAGEVPDLGG